MAKKVKLTARARRAFLRQEVEQIEAAIDDLNRLEATVRGLTQLIKDTKVPAAKQKRYVAALYRQYDRGQAKGRA